MYHERLITGVAATLGAIAVLLTVVAVFGSPVAFPVAVAFAASAVLMYDQLSGRMAARAYRLVEQRARVSEASDGRGRRAGDGGTDRRRAARDRGGFGAGPREEWTPPRDGATVGEAATSGRHRSGRRGGGTARSGARATRSRRTDDGPSNAAAYRTLGLEPGAEESEVKAAYREKVKDVHPDTEDGDEEQFMAVKDAYERLTE